MQTADIVIPLQVAIIDGAVYRKFTSTGGWYDFVEDDLNHLRSASSTDGTCPPAGSNLYRDGLNVGDLCVQLTIQDGGANDSDGVRDFVIRDPGGMALQPEPETVDSNTSADAKGRVGVANPWFLLAVSMLGYALNRYRCLRSRL
jgi:hypothetical protein